MGKPSPGLDARLTKARLAIQDGRIEEGVEELRRAIFDAAAMPPGEGRRQVEEILRFAKDNDTSTEVEEVFETESLRWHFFGRQ